MDIKGYNCSNCGGIVLFDIATQKAVCRSCGAVFEREALADYQPNFDAGAGDEDLFDCTVADGGYQQGTDTGAVGDDDSFECLDVVWEGGGTVWEDPESDDLTTGACPSCGAELYGGKTTIATVCPCCGNAQIVAKRIQGMLKPDSIIPFKYDKNRAIEELEKFCKKRNRLLPNRFIKENRLDGIQGVYAPFWLFDAVVEGNIEYEATDSVRGSKHSATYHYSIARDGDVAVSRRNNKITVSTYYYSIVREGDVTFEKVPVDGSEKMDDGYMDAIEPFYYSQLEDFHPSYLAGYAAEKYDVDVQKSKKRAESRMEATVKKLFEDSVKGYDVGTVSVVSSIVNVKKGKVRYALFPVWTVNTKYDGDNYLFMMNGQTDKLVGRLPVDRGKAWMYRGIFTGIFSALITPILYYLNIWGILGSCISLFLLVTIRVLTLGYGPDVIIETLPLPIIIIMAVILSAIGGFWIVRRWIYNMDTAREQPEASDYVVPGSFRLRVEIDERIR